MFDVRDIAQRLNQPVRQWPIDLFRTLVGLLSFGHFARLWWERHLYTSPHGALDHALIESFYPFTIQPLLRPWMGDAWPSAVFLVAMALSLALAAGVRSRWTAAALFLIAVCAYRWNFLVLYVDDAVMHLLLFWVALLPEGQALSWRGRARGWREERAPGMVVRLCLANVALIYAVAGGTKWLSPMWRDGAALYAVLRHPVAWSPEWWDAPPGFGIQALCWVTLVVEPLLALLVVLPRHHPLKYGLLGVGLALHLGIIATMDLVVANLGCLALMALVFHGELAAPPDPEPEGRFPLGWRERVAAVMMARLTVAMIGSSLQPQWRQPVGERPAPLTHRWTAEAGSAAQSIAFAGLWCMGLAQQYRLLDWIDERDVHLRSSRVTVRRGDALETLGYDAFLPRTTRGVLLFSYLSGFTWNALPREQLDRLRPVIAERLARRFCRRLDGDGDVAGRVELDRTSRPGDVMEIAVTFRCASGRAEAIALTTRGTPLDM